jgi:D-alanyl-D-alanine carboxypeptidase/D-alanyl-D-alanine-endopeptidase (penicillin-binding protein 4)
LEYNRALLEIRVHRNKTREWISRRRQCSMVAGILLVTAILPSAMPCAAQKSSSTKASAASAEPRARGRADVARFRARARAALVEVQAQKTYWGVVVADQDTGAILYELNPDHFFTPASNAKIFTTALALASLPPTFRFRTTLESQGVIGADGRLAGDLRFVGRGDPDLSNRKFPYAGKVEHDGPVERVLGEMVEEAVAKGLKEVDGDLVADDSYFPYDPYPAGWSVGDLFFTFGAPVSAIAFNDNSISIDVLPGASAGEPALITVEPGTAIAGLGHEITTGASDAKPDFAVVRRPGTDFLLLRGLIPIGHASMKLDLAMLEPAEMAARTLEQLLEERGVRVIGTIRVHHAPPPDTSEAGDLPPLPEMMPANGTPPIVLVEHLSRPLIESVRVTNKMSHNLHAELLLRTVAREKTAVGSSNAGLKVEQDFLRSAGIADGDVVLVDGSGLSGTDLVTPRAVVQLLRYAAQQPWGSDYISTFPIAGTDGTLEGRMKGTTAEGLIRAKTGALEHVRALSGYVTTLRGEHLVFSIFGNHSTQKGRDATVAIDAIGIAMVETLGAQAPPKQKK